MKENQIFAVKLLTDIADKINKECFDQTPDVIERLTILLLATLHYNSNSPSSELKHQQEAYTKAYTKAYSKVIKLTKDLSNDELSLSEKSTLLTKEFIKK